MKILAKCVLLGIILFPVYFFWRRDAPVPAPALPAGAVTASPDLVSSSGPAVRPATRLVNTLVALRWKLRLWRESRLNHPDDSTDCDQLLQEMLALVRDDNVAAIVAALSPADLNTLFGLAALHHWMQLDPVSATCWLASRPDTNEAENLAVADDWVRQPAGLQDCLAQLPASEWKQSFMGDVGAEMSVHDPTAAVKLASQMEPGSAQINLFRTVAGNWVGTDPQAAFQWVNSVTDPALRTQLVAATAQSYALTDPVQAANWMVSSISSGALMNDTALNIVKTWAAQNPAQAADWVSDFPAGSVKAAAVQIVAGYWVHTDRDAANAWVQNTPVEPASPAN